MRIEDEEAELCGGSSTARRFTVDGEVDAGGGAVL